LLWVGFRFGTAFRSGIGGLGRSGKICRSGSKSHPQQSTGNLASTVFFFLNKKREETKSVPDPDLQDPLLFVPPGSVIFCRIRMMYCAAPRVGLFRYSLIKSFFGDFFLFVLKKF
jgi:hypothetical protein